MAERNRLHLLVEGQTEETIVRDIIEPHLGALSGLVSWSILTTKRPASGPAHKGGVTSWARVEREIRRLLGDTSLGLLTTVMDYYAFPRDAPGMADRPSGDAYAQVEHVERAMASAISDERFLPNLVLHETETWVLAAHEQLGELCGDPDLAGRLCREVDGAGGPELVNDGPATAPSKRLLRHRPGYNKVLEGPLAIMDLGLAPLRARCPHLDRWLARLEAALLPA